jgi:hypothetical protein
MSAPSGLDTQATAEASAADLQKTENRKKAEELRAKAIAQLEKAGKKAAPQQANAGHAHKVASIRPPSSIESENESQLPPADLFSPESFLAAGKAAAQAKMKGPEQKPQVPATPTHGPSAAIRSGPSNVQ